MRFFKKKLSRAEAIARAIDMSTEGDSISIHSSDCVDPSICICVPKMLYIDGGPVNKNPIGFRMDKNGRQ